MRLIEWVISTLYPRRAKPSKSRYTDIPIALDPHDGRPRASPLKCARVRGMSTLAERSEKIAAHLVSHGTNSTAVPHDTAGRQSAVDYLLHWPDGRTGALEVTLIVKASSIEWQGLALKEKWRWPATSSWEFRANKPNFPYRSTRRAALRAVELCDEWSVDNPESLPADVLANEDGISAFLEEGVGDLGRAQLSPGIVLYPSTRVEFVDATPDDFNLVVESWIDQPHVPSHIKKLLDAPGASERHLFLVPLDEVLPAKFFTDDFEAPETAPKGFPGLDGIWVWSNFWHRYLVRREGSWSWIEFPPKVDT